LTWQTSFWLADMNRTESLAMWARIARGALEDPEENTEDLYLWLRATATKIIEADAEPDAGKRPGRVVMAAGLTGKEDPYARLREAIDLWLILRVIDSRNAVIGPEKRTAELIAGAHEFALARGVLWGEYASDPKKAKDLIRDNWPKQI